MLEKIWYGDSLLRWILWPLSLIYLLVVEIKALLYRLRIFKTHTFDAPLIVVGNITVGGTGKTPLCIALCHYLQAQGFKPGLVSRGYGGKATSWPQTVTTSSDPKWVGDEPVLLVKRTGCPMVVGPDRVAAVETLLSSTECNVVISDDGLQHYRMGRDFEVVILDKSRGLGNGLCLPAGPLRESISRLKKVDAVIVNGDEMVITPDFIYAINNTQQRLGAPDTDFDKRICAVAGIGNPQRFFDTLANMGYRFDTKVFSDHHQFSADDLESIDSDLIIMTEKDAVKCLPFADARCYALSITASVPEVLVEKLGMLLKFNKESK